MMIKISATCLVCLLIFGCGKLSDNDIIKAIEKLHSETKYIDSRLVQVFLHPEYSGFEISEIIIERIGNKQQKNNKEFYPVIVLVKGSYYKEPKLIIKAEYFLSRKPSSGNWVAEFSKTVEEIEEDRIMIE